MWSRTARGLALDAGLDVVGPSRVDQGFVNPTPGVSFIRCFGPPGWTKLEAPDSPIISPSALNRLPGASSAVRRSALRQPCIEWPQHEQVAAWREAREEQAG